MSNSDEIPLADDSLKSPIQCAIDTVFETSRDIYHTFISIEEFQCQIIRFFIFKLIFICICIIFVWRKYGSRITERFMRPGSNRIVDDLRTEATDLKLPKEHTPRI